MFSSLTSRRGFAARLATLIPGLAAAGAVATAAPSPQAASGVKKLDYEGKPAGTAFITPLILHNDTIYIARQGSHPMTRMENFQWTSRPTPKRSWTMSKHSSKLAARWTASCSSRSISRRSTILQALRLPLRVYEYGQSDRRDDCRILHSVPRRQIWLRRGIPRRRRGRRPWRDRLAVCKT